MANEPKRVSRHEKHGKPQGCHERLLHHTTALACLSLQSPTRGGEHGNGSTLQPVSGTVGASVFEETPTVHAAALRPPIHVAALPSCALWRQTSREKTGIRQWGRCVRGTQECRASWGSYALHGTHSHFRVSWWGPCIAWDSLTHIILELQGEVGGWRWLSGVRRCASRKAHAPIWQLGSGSVSANLATACEMDWPPPPCVTSLLQKIICQSQLL